MLLKDLELSIVDIETTGGRYFSNRIIEIGVLRISKGEVVDTFDSLIHPQRSIPPAITALTGISDGHVHQAPTFDEVHRRLLELFEGSIFVAHNVRFDYGFLRHEFERMDIRFQSRVLCSVRLSRALFRRYKRHDLSSIIQRFDLPMENRHRAFDDARAVWHFFDIIRKTVDPQREEEALKKILAQPSRPPGLKTDLADLPEKTGVYIFLDEGGHPIYIGKAKDLRARILSHFSSDLRHSKSLEISRRVTEIETLITHGELAALLLESHLIKKRLPLYNRRLRRHWKLSALRYCDLPQDYSTVEICTYEAIKKDDLQEDIIALFRTQREAVRYLEGVARDYQLCPSLLGLEKSRCSSSCLTYQIQRCGGAAIGEMPFFKHNMRLKEALGRRRQLAWPFPGAVRIEETDVSGSRGEVIVVDNWIIQDAFRFDGDMRSSLFEVDYCFDLDAYRILCRYLQKRSNLECVTSVPSASTSASFSEY